ncbi:putative short-chain dehydrogenase/reductase family protein [Hypoxylon cercidicola]|nr:putative short-chain dehydrogenase/reductase family protein [Hypoxylon cercidicola]
MSSDLESQAPFESTLLGFFYRQFTRPKPLPEGIDLTGQVAIVTGSNTGIGFGACQHLLKLRLGHLIMGVRSQKTGDEAAGKLRKEFPGSKISVWTADMLSYDSIRDFAEKCATLPRIDFVILNAALIKSSYVPVASTGHETTLQVDYLSTALLSILLLPTLKSKKAVDAKRPPVLSIVGSDMAYRVDIETRGPLLQQFDKPEGYATFLWYGRAKMLLVFFMIKLAELVDPDDVLINMPNPGTCGGTSFFREWPTLSGLVVALLQSLFARSVEVGATTYLDAAIVQGKESHGNFLSDWTFKPYPLLYYKVDGKGVIERLWEETMQEFNFIGASKIIEDMRRRP